MFGIVSQSAYSFSSQSFLGVISPQNISEWCWGSNGEYKKMEVKNIPGDTWPDPQVDLVMCSMNNFEKCLKPSCVNAQRKEVKKLVS